MAIKLPSVIADYFAADRHADAQAISRCFAPAAVVIDEGKSHIGRAAIAQWMANASTQYSYTVEPFALVHEGDHTVVTSHLTGNFPGSPVDLRYRFMIDGNQITRLEIAP